MEFGQGERSPSLSCRELKPFSDGADILFVVSAALACGVPPKVPINESEFNRFCVLTSPTAPRVYRLRVAMLRNRTSWRHRQEL